MGANIRFYKPPEYYYTMSERHLKSAEVSGKITARDRELIEEYISEMDAQDISPVRHYKLIVMLVGNFDFHPHYEDCTITDVQSIPAIVRRAVNPDGSSRYKKNTIADRIRMAKRIFIWLNENGYITLDSRKLQGIKTPQYDKFTVTAEDILTVDEIEKFLSCCYTSRDQAMFWMMYEGALRVGEIGNLRFRDVKITERFCSINTSEKTGKPRYIPLVNSRPYFTHWINDYPAERKPDNFVFLNARGKVLTRAAIAKQMRIIAKRAGITKDVWPHLLRHSRITHLLQANPAISESHIKLMCWGDVNTPMLATYQHLTNTDLERSVALLNGLDTEESGDSESHKRTLKPVLCRECGHINAATMQICEACGSPLTKNLMIGADNIAEYIRDKIMKDPKFLCMITSGINVK